MKILHIGVMAGYPNGWEKALNKRAQCIHVGMGKVGKVQSLVNENFDLIFIQTQAGGALPDDVIRRLKGFKVNWCGDVREPLPAWYLKTAEVVDITCFSNRRDVETMKSLGFKSEFLEIGFDPEIYNRSKRGNRGTVVFCANHFGGFPLSGLRQQIVNRFRGKYDFHHYGVGWPDTVFLNQTEEAEAYANCKIAINCSHFDFYTSDRLWRILGSGAFCLSHHYEGIERDFKVGEHLVTWRTLEDLEAEIIHYLESEERRQKIADSGYQFAHYNNTFDHMADRLIDIYNRNK